MIKRKMNSVTFVRKTIKMVSIAMVIFMALSVQASACHIADLVWNDLDRDGIQDDNEPGIPGIIVELYNCSTDNYIGSDTTDTDGIYSFSVDDNVGYYLQFELPSGWEFSPQDQGNDDTKDSDADPATGNTTCIVVRGEYNSSWDAGMYETATVGDYVWEDCNNNGIQDPGEPGIEGVEVELYVCNGSLVASTTTDTTGFYEFTGLMPGSYYIKYILPNGFVFAPYEQGADPAVDSDADTGGVTSCFTLSAGECNNVIDAGLFAPEQEIPEFPTIALPVVAIIGLAFIFQRRKENWLK
ncbi:MAG: PEF-CTERM sorting domain-containing protein [Methanosarcinaceae archaeon]|nr:PEF-CTERM sorting domain-containing protein [Methanosarcinaceae archaeon]